MAKHIKFQAQLSPENYIKQKARNLPVDKCFISQNWKEMGMFTVLVTRQHMNSNLTVGIFMVDLLCMGIRDSLYYFNITREEFDKIIESNKEEDQVVETDYNTAHNVIFAAYEYALNLGFEPHHSFKITQFILEEDNEDVPMIEIETGMDGKPMFIYDDELSDFLYNKIITQLNKSVGEGNYLTLNSSLTTEEEIEEARTIDLYRSFVALSPEERQNRFFEMYDKMNNLDPDVDVKDLYILTEAIIQYDICDPVKTDAYEIEWRNDYPAKFVEEDYNAEFLGINPEIEISEEDKEEFEELEDYFDDDDLDKFEVLLKSLKKKWGEIPFLSYLELSSYDSDKELMTRFDAEILKFPNYPLLKLGRYKLELELISTDNLGIISGRNLNLIKLPDYKEYFPEGSTITHRENMEFVSNKLLAIELNIDFEALASMMLYVIDYRLDKYDSEFMEEMYNMQCINQVHKFLSH